MVASVLAIRQLEARVDGGPDVIVAHTPAADTLKVSLCADAGDQAEPRVVSIVDGSDGAAREDAGRAWPATAAPRMMNEVGGRVRWRGRVGAGGGVV